MPVADYYPLTQQIYIAYFGRPADPNGRAAFAKQLMDAGVTSKVTDLVTTYATSPGIKALVDSFAASTESSALYGAADTTQFVTAIFQNVLGRPPKLAGLTFWQAEIDSGRVTRAGAALKIMAGAFANTSDPAQAALDQALINNRTKVAGLFTDAIDTIEEVISYRGQTNASLAREFLKGVTADTNPESLRGQIDALLLKMDMGAVPGTVLASLTANADSITGTAANEVVNASIDASSGKHTLSAGDVIDLGAGFDVVNLLDTTGGAIDLGLATLRNVEHLRVSSSGSLVNQRADVSGFAGLSNVTIDVAGPAHTITAGATTWVKATNTGGGVSVVGGASIDVTAGTGQDAAVVAVSNTHLGIARVKNGSTVTITDGSADRSYLSTVSLDGNSGAAVLTGDVLSTVNVFNTSQDVTVHNRTAGHAINFNLQNANGVLSDATAGAVNLLATRSASDVIVNAAAATDISIETAINLGLTLHADAAQTLRFKVGSGAVTIDASSKLASLTLINAALFAGDITIEGELGSELFYLGSRGRDTLTVNASSKSIATAGGNDHVTLGNGVIQLDLGVGDDVVVLGNQNSVTGGLGKDSFDLSATVVTSGASYNTIVDFGAGDSIRFKDGGAYGAKLAAKVTAGGTFAERADAAAAGTSAGQLTWFTFGSDTYVVNDLSSSTSFVNGVDQIVKLSGTPDLSSAILNADGVLSIA